MRAFKAVSWIAVVAAIVAGCSSRSGEVPVGELDDAVKQASERASVAGERAAAAVHAKAPEGSAPARVEQQAAIANATAQQREMQKGSADAAVIDWRTLAPFLPDRLGRYVAIGKLEGHTNSNAGPKMSAVHRTYELGTRRATVQINDALIAKVLQAPFAVAATFTRDTPNGFKRALQVRGRPAILDWNGKEELSRIAVMVGGRFVLDIRVTRAQNPSDAQSLAEGVNFAGLAKLAAQPAVASTK